MCGSVPHYGNRRGRNSFPNFRPTWSESTFTFRTNKIPTFRLKSPEKPMAQKHTEKIDSTSSRTFHRRATRSRRSDTGFENVRAGGRSFRSNFPSRARGSGLGLTFRWGRTGRSETCLFTPRRSWEFPVTVVEVEIRFDKIYRVFGPLPTARNGFSGMTISENRNRFAVGRELEKLHL